jgi:hypothetical protein
MGGPESRPNAHILPTIGDVPVTKWRVEHSGKVTQKGSKTLHAQRGRDNLRGQLSAMRKLAWWHHRSRPRGSCGSASTPSPACP